MNPLLFLTKELFFNRAHRHRPCLDLSHGLHSSIHSHFVSVKTLPKANAQLAKIAFNPYIIIATG